jgi:hypothetical protein
MAFDVAAFLGPSQNAGSVGDSGLDILGCVHGSCRALDFGDDDDYELEVGNIPEILPPPSEPSGDVTVVELAEEPKRDDISWRNPAAWGLRQKLTNRLHQKVPLYATLDRHPGSNNPIHLCPHVV